MNMYDAIVKKEPITQGWSEDEKYCVTTADATKYLLRVAPLSEYETRKSLFSILEKAVALDVPMCMPVEFGICDDGVYFLQEWINGTDLDIVLPTLSDAEQYVLGVESGKILQKIHKISAPATFEEWETHFSSETDMNIKKYQACGLRFSGDDYMLTYIEQNRYLLKNRPQCFHHGDFSARNIMIENGALKCIDFERYYFGDPFYEFFYVMLEAVQTPHFTSGQFCGYFNGEPPLYFFKLYAFYIVSNFLSAIYEATLSGQNETDAMLKQSQQILQWFGNMQNPIPAWYSGKSAK